MPKPSDLATTCGIDIGKNGLHLVALDGQGTFRRKTGSDSDPSRPLIPI
jgi:hypothetical protein